MGDELSRLAKLGWPVPPESIDGVRYFSGIGQDPLWYPDEGLEVLGLEGGPGYWFDHRAAAVSRAMNRLQVKTVWEVGSGTGAMACRLVSPLREVITVEPLAEGAQSAARLGLPSLCGTLQDLGLPNGSLECIGAFDVIEHIPSVSGFLGEVRRVLRPGGIAVVTVPAFPLLWGDEDDAAGHQRRYTRASMQAQFVAGGFTPLHVEYLYASLVAPAAITRALPYRLGRRRTEAEVLAALKSQLRVSPAMDRIARVILSTEARIARHLTLPFGLSLLGVFRAA